MRPLADYPVAAAPGSDFCYAIVEKMAARQEKKNDTSSELDAPLWSVVSFEGIEAGGLTYVGAREKLAELDAKRVTGLCIVTNHAAGRLHDKNATTR